MSTIDPTARIEDGAVIGAGTLDRPYCIIGPHVVIGADCKLVAHVMWPGTPPSAPAASSILLLRSAGRRNI